MESKRRKTVEPTIEMEYYQMLGFKVRYAIIFII